MTSALTNVSILFMLLTKVNRAKIKNIDSIAEKQAMKQPRTLELHCLAVRFTEVT